MSALVYDYKSIAAHMKGELAPKPDQLCENHERSLTVHVPIFCVECGSCGRERYCVNIRCPLGLGA